MWKMRRSVKSRGARKARSVIQWSEQKLARDAAAAALRGVAASAYPNIAQRGLVLNPGEFKSVDFGGTLAVNSDVTYAFLNGISPGTEIDQRVGREVTMRSIQFQYVLRPLAGGVDQTARVLLVYDRQTNATALTADQVLSTVTTVAPRNLENRKRFKILYDRTHVLSPPAVANTAVSRRFYRRLSHPVTFNSLGMGTIGDIITGSLYAIFIGTEDPGATAATVTFSSRVRYTDQ